MEKKQINELINQEEPQIVKNEVGSWNQYENLKYAVFIFKNKGLYSKKKRSNQQFFVQMSINVKSRTSIQCRCHHQKVLQKYKSLKKIIHHYQSVFRKKKLEAYLQKFHQKSMTQPKKNDISIEENINKNEQEKVSLTSSNITASQMEVNHKNEYYNSYWNGYMLYPFSEQTYPLFWMNYGNNISLY